MSKDQPPRSNGDTIMIDRRSEGQRERETRGRRSAHPAIGNRWAEAEAVVAGDCRDPFGFLGLHLDGPGKCATVRVFYPGATRMQVLHAGDAASDLERVHPSGLWAVALTDQRERFAYRLRVT